jgi:hypothetical protein
LGPLRPCSSNPSRMITMGKRKNTRDGERESIIAGFTRGDFERLNRFAHAKSLHSIIKCTKWLNYHGLELLQQYPQEFCDCTGMTVEEYVRALTVHIDCCRTFVERMERLRPLTSAHRSSLRRSSTS